MDATEARRQELMDEHRRLEKQLAEELKHWAPNQTTVTDIKKRKLRIKETLAGMMEPG